VSILSKWRATYRALRARPSLDRELDRELAGWIDELTARYEAAAHRHPKRAVARCWRPVASNK